MYYKLLKNISFTIDCVVIIFTMIISYSYPKHLKTNNNNLIRMRRQSQEHKYNEINLNNSNLNKVVYSDHFQTWYNISKIILSDGKTIIFLNTSLTSQSLTNNNKTHTQIN